MANKQCTKLVKLLMLLGLVLNIINNVNYVMLQQSLSPFNDLLFYNINTSQVRNVNNKLLISSPTNTVKLTLYILF